MALNWMLINFRVCLVFLVFGCLGVSFILRNAISTLSLQAVRTEAMVDGLPCVVRSQNKSVTSEFGMNKIWFNGAGKIEN